MVKKYQKKTSNSNIPAHSPVDTSDSEDELSDSPKQTQSQPQL